MEQHFLDQHINIFLQNLAESKRPLDLSLSQYFRAHKNLGSTDRKKIGDAIYGQIRWKSLLDVVSPKDRLTFLRNINWDSITKDPSIPSFAKVGLSTFLYDLFVKNFGVEKTNNLGEILNGPAPTTVRANLLKTTRQKLLELWENKFSVSPTLFSPTGIQFHKREPLFSLSEFKEGLFEMQDEGSQLVASYIEAKPTDLILDYCSGSGGKTLAFAPSMQGKGQIYLHDIRLRALEEARVRLRRAGIQNAQCLHPNHPQLPRLIGKCDWVFIDVPCTGTGTLRRNPDQKWKIDAAMLERLIQEQRTIAERSLKYLKPGGRLVYATCSLLPEENMRQVDYFLATHPITLEKEPVSLFPKPQGMDGFFCAIFRKSPAYAKIPEK